jgi:hypothetical protein
MGKLIYALVSTKNDSESLNSSLADLKGIGGADLHSATFESISVVTSNLEGSLLTSDKSSALDFAAVIEKLGENFTLLPVRFGSLTDTDDSILKIIRVNYQDMLQNLIQVENRQEYGLRVFCEPEKLKDQMRNELSAESKALDKISPDTPVSASMDWIRVKLNEHRMEEKMLKYVDNVVSEILTELDGLKVINKFTKMTTPSNIIDAVFLMEKSHKDALIKAIEKLQSRYKGLRFMLTGPWQPYSFVDIRIK